MKRTILLLACVALVAPAMLHAKIDLVTLPERNSVQLTIYNSADLTLVKESRLLTLRKGVNRLQFSWANTLIDPTSLDLLAREQADKITVSDLAYPPGIQGAGVWTIQSRVSGKVPVEITYLTSGLAWRAFYLGTLSADEKTMRLEGFVRVTNSSGEDYEDAQTRLIVGQVHLLDQIAELARRQYPYGNPRPMPPNEEAEPANGPIVLRGLMAGRDRRDKVDYLYKKSEAKPKAIQKEGLSEYFLYSIEGTETIPNQWSKRLPSFDKPGVPVVNLYKYEEERYGRSVVRFLSFKNANSHKLGDTPIPGGDMRIYRLADPAAHLSYEGRSRFKYIPVDQEAELSLGAVANVVVKPTLMAFATDSYMFATNGNISGWDEIRDFKVEVKNTRDVPVKIEIQRNFPTPKWDLEKSGDFGTFAKVDMDTVKFTLTLEARTQKEFQYTIRTYHGTRGQ